MSSHDRKRISELFQEACDLAPDARKEFLDKACGENAELRAEIESLLAHDREVSGPDGSATVSAKERTNPATILDRTSFVPGALLARRYRVVGLLGRGGMGEVYRADDLKLGQAVALKFLPAQFERDPNRVRRFRDEVKIARQVTHSNVCRIYDIDDIDGQHFISMEYVDGENLASLLRRIGRLPRDKAVQIARQLCAGLAAAHEQGIVHRDIKPENVMIDGRGRVRITDFGLAALAEEIEGSEIRAGTPLYMSPEQLSGREVTVKSDLYSLGLVLYELFTGQRPYDTSSLPELMRQQEETTPPRPSDIVQGLDESVESVILRCLERDPAGRPGSTLAVLAALPGGDPLAAALAAGETPSPEMVADAGKVGGLRPAVGVVCLAVALLGLLANVAVYEKTSITGQVSLDKPPGELALAARSVIAEMGYSEPPKDAAYAFEYAWDYFSYMQNHSPSDYSQWSPERVQPAPIVFWYRQSPKYLVPNLGTPFFYYNMSFTQSPVMAFENPPPLVSGMAGVKLDPQGRLLQFLAVPPRQDRSRGPEQDLDWFSVFQSAGLDLGTFTLSDAEWTPPVPCDRRNAWEGAYPAQPEIPVRVETGSYRGRAVYFEVVMPWTRPDPSTPLSPWTALVMVVFLGALLGGLPVARANLRLGRGDRRGALRLAGFWFLVNMLVWVLSTHHSWTVDELFLLIEALAASVGGGCAVWMTYIALEPHIRRLWPSLLVSWSRLVTGRFQDPMIGRDLLIGSASGSALALINSTPQLVAAWRGWPHEESLLLFSALSSLNGLPQAMVNLISLPNILMFEVILTLLLLLLFYVILRRRWAAIGAVVLYHMVLMPVWRFEIPYVGWPVAAVVSALLIYVLFRFGTLAFAMALLHWDVAVMLVLTTDLSAWYAGRTFLPLLALATLAIYGFYLSLAGRPLFKGRVLDG